MNITKRKFSRICGFALLCLVGSLASFAWGQTAPEDLPIADEVLGQPAPTAPSNPVSVGKARPTPALPTPATPPSPATIHSHDTIEEHQENTESTPDAFAFMRNALYAGLIVAAMCSFLGVYVVLKRIVFVGVALAEISSAGIALALLFGFAPLLGAIGFMLVGVLLFSIRWSPRRVPHESYIGIMYSMAAALGILLIAKSPQGETHMLTLLQGNVLTVRPVETVQMLGIFAAVGLVHLLFGKEFLLVSFDRESAATLGFRVSAWDSLLFLTIGLVISFSIRSVGVLMTSSMLILPAATALLITSRLKHAFLVALPLGGLPVIAGLYLSYINDLPASAVIVALSFLMMLPALAYNFFRRRG